MPQIWENVGQGPRDQETELGTERNKWRETEGRMTSKQRWRRRKEQTAWQRWKGEGQTDMGPLNETPRGIERMAVRDKGVAQKTAREEVLKVLILRVHFQVVKRVNFIRVSQ